VVNIFGEFAARLLESVYGQVTLILPNIFCRNGDFSANDKVAISLAVIYLNLYLVVLFAQIRACVIIEENNYSFP
jgi:hypothetical protein